MQTQRGDVSILIVMTIILIISFIVIATSQSTLRSIQLNRQGVGSQQAVQVANMGIERWLADFQLGRYGDDLSGATTEECVRFNRDGTEQLDCSGANIGDFFYQVRFDTTNNRLISRGTVILPRENRVSRVLEVQF